MEIAAIEWASITPSVPPNIGNTMKQFITIEYEITEIDFWENDAILVI